MSSTKTSISKVRRNVTSDAPNIISGINAICREGGAFYVTHFVPSSEWISVLDYPATMPHHLIAVAEIEGNFAGSGRLFPGPRHSFMPHVVELGLYVLKPYRRQGVASLLLDWMLDWTRSRGYEKVTLSVFASNIPAISLYQKFGFVEEGRWRRQLKIGIKYEDMLSMSLFLHSF